MDRGAYAAADWPRPCPVPPLAGCPSPDSWPAWATGALPPGSEVAATDHALGCPACQALALAALEHARP